MDNKALSLAWEAHKNQKRKGTDIPYIIHLIETSVILSENGAKEDVVTAGILHDILEDTDIKICCLEENFGKNITELVVSVTEKAKLLSDRKMSKEEKEATWYERKKEKIHYLRKASEDVKLIACADKLSNLRSLIEDYKIYGEKLWSRFNNKDPKAHEEYYRYLVECLKTLKDYDMYKEFSKLVEEFFSFKASI